MRILSSEAMAAVDRHAIEEIGIPGLVLMENAAIGVADAIGRSFPDASRAAIFCGPGNNGGDGLAVGRHLSVRGYRVELFLVLEGRELSGDAARQEAICRRLGLEPTVVEGRDGRDGRMGSRTAVARAARSDLIVDALFGTGLGRPLEGTYAELVEALGRLPVPKVAVDLPSGLSGSRTDLFGPHLPADLTVTFAAPKPAQVFPPAAGAVGELVVVDLGVPVDLLERPADEPPLHLVTAEDAAALVIPRSADSHKGDHGHLLVVAGSRGKAGAAVLAARAAVRGGAGLVTVAVPAPAVSTVETASLESMTVTLPADSGGDGEGQARPAGLVERILEAADGKDAVALGPGLGRGEELEAALRRAVVELQLPLVLDADGLNAFAGRLGELDERRAPTVLTPHPGELARLLGVETSRVVADRVEAARRAAGESGAVVLAKGHRTVVARPDGTVHVNTTGNPGMASGGSGDVLTGLVGALLAGGTEVGTAAVLGAYLHGLAGDLAAHERGETGLAAGDLVDRLPAALRHLVES